MRPGQRSGPVGTGPQKSQTPPSATDTAQSNSPGARYRCGRPGCRYCRRSVFAALDELLADAVPGTVVVPMRGGRR